MALSASWSDAWRMASVRDCAIGLVPCEGVKASVATAFQRVTGFSREVPAAAEGWPWAWAAANTAAAVTTAERRSRFAGERPAAAAEAAGVIVRTNMAVLLFRVVRGAPMIATRAPPGES